MILVSICRLIYSLIMIKKPNRLRKILQLTWIGNLQASEIYWNSEAIENYTKFINDDQNLLT